MTSPHPLGEPLELSSGLPHTNTSAMMGAPFSGKGRLKSLAFSFNFRVGYPAQPAKPVTCAPSTKLAGGSIHIANLSSVQAAISWCQAAIKCAGFTRAAVASNSKDWRVINSKAKSYISSRILGVFSTRA